MGNETRKIESELPKNYKNGDSYWRYRSQPCTSLEIKERAVCSQPGGVGVGGGVWGQWAFCWGLKWVIKVKGWQWRRGRNAASGRELLIRGETQTLQIHLHSGRSQSQGATKLRVHNLYPQSKSYLFFPAPESSVGKAGPEPRCHPGDLCFSAWSQGTCREFLGFSQPKFLSFSTTSHYSYASRPSSPPFHSAL